MNEQELYSEGDEVFLGLLGDIRIERYGAGRRVQVARRTCPLLRRTFLDQNLA